MAARNRDSWRVQSDGFAWLDVVIGQTSAVLQLLSCNMSSVIIIANIISTFLPWPWKIFGVNITVMRLDQLSMSCSIKLSL